MGAHAATKFGERLGPLDLSPPHAGILRAIGINAGTSQQALSGFLRILPSRLVTLVDELEERGLIERRDSPDDRRVYALHLTSKGFETLEAIGRIGREHNAALCAALTESEQQQLASLLTRIADAEGLVFGAPPERQQGFARVGPEGPKRDDVKLRREGRRGK